MHSNTHERGLRKGDPHANPGVGLPHHNQPSSGHGTTAAGANRARVGEETYGRSPATGPAPTTAGHHSHDLLNKLDPRVDSTQDKQAMPQNPNNNNNVPAGTYGPHHSRLANALDPRVDSDLDSSRAGAGMGPGGGLGGGEIPAGGGSVGGAGAVRGMGMHSAPGHEHSGYGGAERGMGMHSAPGHEHSGAAAGHGATGRHAGPPPPGSGALGAHPQPHGAVGGGLGGAHHQPGGIGGASSTTTGGAGMAGGGGAPVGPHKSGLMNKLDPRVDSKTGMKKDGSGPGSSGSVAY